MEIKKSSIETISMKANSVFLSEAWLSMYGDALEVYGIFNKNNDIIGGFTLFVERKLGFLKYYRNPPYSPTINLFFENKAQNKAKLLSENKKVLSLMANFLNNLPFHILSVYLPSNNIDMQAFYWKSFKTVPNYTYTIDLSSDISIIKKNYSTERRNDLKKAIKDGVEAKLCTDYNTVKTLVLNTFTRKDKSIDVAMIDKILFSFANNENSFAFVSYHNGQAIATSFCIFDRQKVYYLLGGYDSQNKHQGAGALSVDAAIKHSKELGIAIFDFEGSMLPEVERYFRGFGGDLVPYYSINKAKLPLEMALKFVNRSQF
jgi:lipid II:glycine glycyltransferase (peptidoglycan interpeptide bridge formation enzyme)